jgi:hypothetical protein
MGYKVYFADFQCYKLIYFLNIRENPGLDILLKISRIFPPENQAESRPEITRSFGLFSRAMPQRRRFNSPFLSRNATTTRIEFLFPFCPFLKSGHEFSFEIP